jgi:hypothetical protein
MASHVTDWCFGTFVIFHNSWDDDPIRLSDFSEGRAQPPTSHGFTYPTIVWLVVSNIFYFPKYKGQSFPLTNDSYFSRWLKPPTRIIFYPSTLNISQLTPKASKDVPSPSLF